MMTQILFIYYLFIFLLFSPSFNSLSSSKDQDLGFIVNIHAGSDMAVEHLPVLVGMREPPSMLSEAVNRDYSL